MRNVHKLSLIFPLLLAACTLPADGDGTVTSALDPIGGMPPTTYRFTLSEMDGVEQIEPPASHTHDTGYVNFAALSVQVGKNEPDATGCIFSPDTFTFDSYPKFGTCAGSGLAVAGSKLQRTFTVTSPTDSVTGDNQVKLAVVLDNVEQVDLTQNPSLVPGILSTVGNVVAGVGAIAGLASGGVGAVLGVIGSGLAVSASEVKATSGGPMYSCAGGLIGAPASGQSTPSDFLYKTFSTQDLQNLTAAGPGQIVFDTNEVVWNGGNCRFRSLIYVTVERLWTDGLAAASKSGDSAVVRVQGNLDSFTADPYLNGVEHDWSVNGESNGFGTEIITKNPQPETPYNFSATPSITDTGMPIAAVSRNTNAVDVFFIDGVGRPFWSAWTPSTSWVTRPIDGGSGSIPSAAITAVAPTANDVDVFWLDAYGSLKSGHWTSGASDFTMQQLVPFQGAGQSSAGGGVAAVARTPSDLDVFWLGKDQSNGSQSGLWWANWNGSAWSTSEIPYTNGLAPLGGNVTAVATSVGNLDVFFIGNDGALRRVSWSNGAPGFLTTSVADSFGPAGGRISAVSQAPGEIDVVASITGAVHRAALRSGGWSSSVVESGSPVVTVNQTVSIVAPDYGTLAVVYHDLVGYTYSAWLPYGAPSWTLSGRLPEVCRPLTCSSAGASCGSVSDGCGGSLSCGSCSLGTYCASNNTCQILHILPLK